MLCVCSSLLLSIQIGGGSCGVSQNPISDKKKNKIAVILIAVGGRREMDCILRTHVCCVPYVIRSHKHRTEKQQRNDCVVWKQQCLCVAVKCNSNGRWWLPRSYSCEQSNEVGIRNGCHWLLGWCFSIASVNGEHTIACKNRASLARFDHHHRFFHNFLLKCHSTVYTIPWSCCCFFSIRCL